jgi:sugar lactone lactonase YvrE
MLLGVAWGQAGGVFWSDRGANQLKRMNFDGSNLQSITLSGAVTSPGSNVRGVAVDNISHRIFWADNGSDSLLRAEEDGSSSVILHTIAGGNSFPADVRLDLENQSFYWCDQARSVIERSTLDGASVTSVITNAAATGPYFMDLDLAAGKIYWGDFGGGAIYRASLDGSGRETLLTGNNQTRGVKVDAGGQMLYWINRNDKKVHRCPLSAFAGGTISLTHPAVQTLYTNLDTPHGLALDIPARKLYWADTGENIGTGSGDKAVSRGDFDGSSPMEVLAVGSQPWDVDLDLRCASYAEWRWRCFRRDAPTTQSSPDADPDGDGVKNALEYAFNISPLHPDALRPVGLLSAGPEPNATYPALKFKRRSDTSDLSYVVQVSTNLVIWAGSPADPQTTEIRAMPLGDGMEEVTVRTLSPLSHSSPYYLRLTVILGP